MLPNPDMTAHGHSTIARSYNMLLRGIERYAEALSYSSLVGKNAGWAVAARRPLAALLGPVTAAPLYALSHSAVKRAAEVAQQRDAANAISLPTIPECGATIADSTSAIFLQIEEPEVAEAHHPTVPEAADFRLVRFVEGRIEEINGHALEIIRYGDLYIGMREGRYAYNITNLDVCIAVPTADTQQITTIITDKNDDMRGYTLVVKGGVATEVIPLPRDQYDDSTRSMTRDVQVALEQLAFIDMPSHYVVAECPLNARPSRAKAARFDDRERWILLDPEEAKKKYAERVDDTNHDGTHASPTPHLRKAHDRELRSERYRFKRGTVLHIRPTWIGEREWKTRGMRYRVVSRVGATDTQA